MLGPPLMPAVFGVPQEDAMVISSFIMTDILKRFRKLKLVFSHGGGTIGSVIDRITCGWNAFDVMRNVVARRPIEYLRRFWYDSVVFGGDYLAYLVRKFGAEPVDRRLRMARSISASRACRSWSPAPDCRRPTPTDCASATPQPC